MSDAPQSVTSEADNVNHLVDTKGGEHRKVIIYTWSVGSGALSFCILTGSRTRTSSSRLSSHAASVSPFAWVGSESTSAKREKLGRCRPPAKSDLLEQGTTRLAAAQRAKSGSKLSKLHSCIEPILNDAFQSCKLALFSEYIEIAPKYEKSGPWLHCCL